MNNIKKALLALLLASGAATSSAAAINGYDFVMGVGSDGTRQDYHFTIGNASVKKGDTFSYDLLFNTPPLAPTTYFGFLVGGDQKGSVKFNDGAFTDLLGDELDGYMLSVAGKSVSGSGFLDSGTYDLYLSGTFLADGAMVVGNAVDDLNVANVPEPMSLSLLGLGLAGIAGIRRKKAA